jgi:hypothetical protein
MYRVELASTWVAVVTLLLACFLLGVEGGGAFYSRKLQQQWQGKMAEREAKGRCL